MNMDIRGEKAIELFDDALSIICLNMKAHVRFKVCFFHGKY